jgi:hypothetical protein
MIQIIAPKPIQLVTEAGHLPPEAQLVPVEAVRFFEVVALLQIFS